ncbi:hypothetical protein KGO95_01540 [Patescibacteria group bacterium]|nr:hypothetical protein [Patescibacteria group bacterium]
MAKSQESLPTQQFIGIESIDAGVVKLKGGALRKVLLVSGINFSLKSEEEQGLITYAFQGFLNSLNFSVQVFVHSRKLNVEEYLQKFGEREQQEPNQLLKNLIVEYREFIKSFVSQNAIMQKTFFVIVPYDPVGLSKTGAGIADTVLGFFKPKTAQAPAAKPEDAAETLEQLDQRVDRVVSGLNQVGLRAVPLDTDELLELFYNLYNPTTTEKKGIEFTEKK